MRKSRILPKVSGHRLKTPPVLRSRLQAGRRLRYQLRKLPGLKPRRRQGMMRLRLRLKLNRILLPRLRH